MQVICSLLTFSLLVAVVPKIAQGRVCNKDTYRTVYYTQTYYTSCGWLGWGRCSRQRTATRSVKQTIQECCSGNYGLVSTGCTGECPSNYPSASSLCGGRSCRNYMCDRSRVDTSFSKFKAHENDNDAELLFKVNATCFVQRTCSNCNCPCSSNEPCTSCTVSNTRLFEVRNGLEVWRRQCNSECSYCQTEVGCLNARQSYSSVLVNCTAGSGDAESMTFTIEVEAAEAPNVTFPESNQTTTISGGLARGSRILRALVEAGKKAGPVSYTLTGVTSPSSGRDLFIFNETTKAIEVAEDLTDEPTHIYNVTLCVITRRRNTCTTVSIHLELLRYCKALRTFNATAGLNEYCQQICMADETACPRTRCTCSWMKAVTEARRNCTATGEWTGTAGINDWCDRTCNAEDPVDCEERCACDPPISQTPKQEDQTRKNCTATGQWAGNAAMNAWCDTTCNAEDPAGCEGTCTCDPPISQKSKQEEQARRKCVATGPWTGNAAMDGWCDTTCNADNPTGCEGTCACE